MKYLIFLGTFQAVVALGLFDWRGKKKTSDNILFWLLICIFAHLFVRFFIYVVSKNQTIYSELYLFINLAYGPLLWLFVMKIKNNGLKRSKNEEFIFLPVLLGAVVYFFIIAQVSINKGAIQPGLINKYNEITIYSLAASFIIYPVRTLLACRSIPSFWKMEKDLIVFIAVLFLLQAVSWCFLIFRNVAGYSLSSQFLYWERMLFYFFLLLICLAVIRYKVISLNYIKGTVSESDRFGTEINSERQIDQAVTTETKPDISEYFLQKNLENIREIKRKHVLPTVQQKAIIESINAIMEIHKIYINPDLTLDNIASELKISRNHISESLNQYLGKSFYQYINEYRIREVIKIMDDCNPKKNSVNILSLAFQAGFNSKSSFNQHFKKVTNQTPSEYFKSNSLLTNKRHESVSAS